MSDFVVQLRPAPSMIPADVRVRKLLKIAARSFGLRCIAVSETPAPSPPEARKPRAKPSEPGEHFRLAGRLSPKGEPK